MNSSPQQTSPSGILLLDKSPGLTSNQALQRAKRLFGVRKAGHTGSLDPLASGILPICFGEATKLCCYLLDADKTYWVRARLGVITATGDADGDILSEHPVPVLESSSLQTVLRRFTGTIRQVPPMFSALKHQGRRLYDLARRGIEVERPPREVTIFELTLLDLGPDSLDLQVVCSKGTYIRSLAEDIGRALGCGAHVQALRRTAVGPFSVDHAYTLEVLESLPAERRSAVLLPADAIVSHWPKVELNWEMAGFFRQGQPVFVPKAPTSGRLRVYRQDGSFLGIGQIDAGGRVAPKRILGSAGSGVKKASSEERASAAIVSFTLS
ncbi:MAG TPA: tRNA pseudouridine(55) synthase TruB [Methylococcus sp.]|nr:tRNA pseudouridine(55) synthase TruB [Methylococcus sp.]